MKNGDPVVTMQKNSAYAAAVVGGEKMNVIRR